MALQAISFRQYVTSDSDAEAPYTSESEEAYNAALIAFLRGYNFDLIIAER
jgi:hypothetical protein